MKIFRKINEKFDKNIIMSVVILLIIIVIGIVEGIYYVKSIVAKDKTICPTCGGTYPNVQIKK